MRLTAMVLLALCACGRFGFGGSAENRDADVTDEGGVNDAAPDAYVRPTAPPPGRNLALDGASYVMIDSVCAELVAGFTVAAWSRPAPDQGGRPYSEIAALNTATGGSNLALMQWVTASMSANYYDDFFTNGTYYTTSAPASQWSYVAMAIDASGVGMLYVNGELAQTFTTSAAVTASSRFSLGQEWDGTTAGEFFIGDLDEVAVWKFVRTPPELLGDMAHPPLLHPDLVAFFDFEAGAITDSTGHGHVGTSVGAATFPMH